MSATILLALRLVLALVLYVFLAGALYILWQELKQRGVDDLTQQVPVLTLTQYDPDGSERVYKFSESKIMIGRDTAIDLNIDDKTISARHAQLLYQHGQWWVEDLQSTNGTFLNLDPVHEQIVITDGDQVRCGRVVLQIAIEDISANQQQET